MTDKAFGAQRCCLLGSKLATLSTVHVSAGVPAPGYDEDYRLVSYNTAVNRVRSVMLHLITLINVVGSSAAGYEIMNSGRVSLCSSPGDAVFVALVASSRIENVTRAPVLMLSSQTLHSGSLLVQQ